jgi:hypothetical protein
VSEAAWLLNREREQRKKRRERGHYRIVNAEEGSWREDFLATMACEAMGVIVLVLVVDV